MKPELATHELLNFLKDSIVLLQIVVLIAAILLLQFLMSNHTHGSVSNECWNRILALSMEVIVTN